MGDAIALGFGATGVLGLISVTLPVPDTMDVRGTVAVALAALLTGIAVYPLRRAIPLWGYHLLLILAIVLISLSIEFNGDLANNNVMLYVFVSAFASWFFAPTWAFVYVLCSLVAYGVVQNDIAEGRMEPTALLVLAGVMLTIGAMSALFGVRARSLIRQLEAEATTDHLTGLLNRRGFQRLVDAELDRVTRRDSTFALVIGDLDRFKEVNDRLGHLVGTWPSSGSARSWTVRAGEATASFGWAARSSRSCFPRPTRRRR